MKIKFLFGALLLTAAGLSAFSHRLIPTPTPVTEAENARAPTAEVISAVTDPAKALPLAKPDSGYPGMRTVSPAPVTIVPPSAPTLDFNDTAVEVSQVSPYAADNALHQETQEWIQETPELDIDTVHPSEDLDANDRGVNGNAASEVF